jgi:enoyl-CoA hydratase/carnithine racemase
MTGTQEPLLYEVKDGIAYVTMNRPDRLNAINGEMAERMHDAWERFEADPNARVAILSGNGRAFCAGQDITPGALDTSVPHQSHRAYPENGKKVFKPIVAAFTAMSPAPVSRSAFAERISRSRRTPR